MPIGGDGEDDLVGKLVVVSPEEILIFRVELVAGGDHLIGILRCLGVVTGAGVDLGIEVDTGKQRLCGSLTGTTIDLLTGGLEERLYRPQLRDDVVVELLAGDLLRSCLACRVLLGDEGDIAVEIHQHPVLEGADEASLRFHQLFLLWLKGRAVHVGEKFVGVLDLDDGAVVGSGDEAGSSVPSAVAQPIDCLIVPGALGFVRGELLEIEERSRESRKSVVDTGDIALRECPGAVDLGKGLTSTLIGREDLGTGHVIGRHPVEIMDAGGEEESGE